jgi:hypothetical protein
MYTLGTLQIATFYTFAMDDHGRELSGKRVNILTKNNVTIDEAKEIFEQVKKYQPHDKHLHATFKVVEHLY